MSKEETTLALIPREGLFFKDGRGWGAGGAGRGRALLWPWPSSVAGALRTAYGRTLEHDDKKTLTRDEWVVQAAKVTLDWLLPLRRKQGEDEWTAAHTMWPVPKDALTLRDKEAVNVVKLRPHPSKALPLEETPEACAVAALWHPRPVNMDDKSKPGKAPAWWTLEEFVAWLCDQDVQKVSEQGRSARSMSVRTDIHLVVDPGTYAAEEGKLFVSDVVETLAHVKHEDATQEEQSDAGYWEWAVGVKVQWPTQPRRKVTDGPLTLGGKGRMATTEDMHDDVDTCPAALKAAFDQQKPHGLRLVAVTPCLFEKQGWFPDGWAVEGEEIRGELEGIGLVLRAACVDRPLAVSGWDMTRETVDKDGRIILGAPKATQLMVAPGAVWFVQRQDGEAFTGADAETLWMKRWGAEAANGAGRVVPGIWNVDVNEDNEKA